MNNALEIERRPWPRSPKPNKPQPLVTVAIGLISKRIRWGKGEIVLASDSESTSALAKNADAQKINTVQFANGRILVAQAGSADLADKAISVFQQRAQAVQIDSRETPAKIAQEAVREVRDHFINLNRNCNFNAFDWKQFFADSEKNFTLMMGYFFKGEPCLYTVDIEWCYYMPVKGEFKSIGIGTYLAEFLLRQYRQSDAQFEYGDLIATAVVEKVIPNVPGCGRPTWVGVVYPLENTSWECESFIYRREVTDVLVNDLNARESEISVHRKNQLAESFRATSEKNGLMIYGQCSKDNPLINQKPE